VIRINEMADNLCELLTSAFGINLSLISVEENHDTKRLAEFAVEQNRRMRWLAACECRISAAPRRRSQRCAGRASDGLVGASRPRVISCQEVLDRLEYGVGTAIVHGDVSNLIDWADLTAWD
jgi:hypothetical protein